jgi:hypothetical protein
LLESHPNLLHIKEVLGYMHIITPIKAIVVQYLNRALGTLCLLNNRDIMRGGSPLLWLYDGIAPVVTGSMGNITSLIIWW